jgi:hypothetical protein
VPVAVACEMREDAGHAMATKNASRTALIRQ